MIKLVLSAEPATEDGASWQPYWMESPLAEAWRQWQIVSCVERHGEHLWELELDHPDDGAGVSLSCSYCPMFAWDLIADGQDLIWLEFDGVTVADGKHDSPVPLIVPVHAEVWGSKTWTDYGYEYDAGINVEVHGPARVVEP